MSMFIAVVATVALVVHLWACLGLLALAGMVLCIKRGETPVNFYEGYEPTEEDKTLCCPWDCGECYSCKIGREPDLG